MNSFARNVDTHIAVRSHPGSFINRGWGVKYMRYSASEKLEIIRTVEQSHLSARETLDKIGISRPTFYRWYDKYLEGGLEALADKPSRPSHVEPYS